MERGLDTRKTAPWVSSVRAPFVSSCLELFLEHGGAGISWIGQRQPLPPPFFFPAQARGDRTGLVGWAMKTADAGSANQSPRGSRWGRRRPDALQSQQER